ncbi:hypothetical protein RF644_17825 [Kocuria sp. CPCC 205258]|uniref:hypothetical protein n=1 Tax=Kocuria sp. CPCC 205258 TaxID=3073552 RepID=UPI0034D7B9B7
MDSQTLAPEAAAPLRGVDRLLPKKEQLLAARRVIGAASRHLGEPVMVRGKRFVVVAPLAVEQFGHPDSRTRLYYGVTGVPGTFRCDVSVAQVADGIVEVEVPWEF